MQGEGLVQVNVQVQTNFKRINIIDVLKPAEDYIHIGGNNTQHIYIKYNNYIMFFIRGRS